MTAKGTIKEDHIPLNKYTLKVAGLPDLTFTKVGGIEEELETVDLPDRTVASGGHTKAIEFDVELPMHHTVEVAAMEAWFRSARDPVAPDYKKPATLVQSSNTGNIVRSWSMLGAFPSKRATPDLEMENEGEMAVLAYTLRADSIDPI